MLSTLYLGTLLLFSLLMGRLVSHMRVPKVIGYLLAGIVLGPSTLSFFSETLSQKIILSLAELRFLSDLALGLIAFNIGGEFLHERFQKIGRKILTISLLETLVTFLIVSVSLLIFTTNISIAICLGILAIATAPAATVSGYRATGRCGRVCSATSPST